MISVVLVEEQAVARLGIEYILAPNPDIKLIASVEEVSEFDFADADVDIVILGGIESDNMARYLAALPARCATVMICGAVDSISPVTAALRHGAVGMVSRKSDPGDLVFAIEAVTKGGCYICSELALSISSGAVSSSVEGVKSGERPVLAPRELETVTLLAQGLTHRQISRRMGLTEATVSTYVKRLRAKLHAGNKAELTRRVIELGYLSLRLTSASQPVTLSVLSTKRRSGRG
jgi:DNA-binding NarL/FixJ family response regulator